MNIDAIIILGKSKLRINSLKLFSCIEEIIILFPIGHMKTFKPDIIFNFILGKV